MSLKEKLQAELNNQGQFTDRATELQVAENNLVLSVELMAADQLAISFTKFSLKSSHLKNASMQKLQKVTEDLCRRVTYLLEPIRPYESDAEQCAVQLRSMPPQKDENGTTYYEVLVKKDGTASLCRYQKVPGNDRQIIPATLTREVFLRLAGDSESSLA